MTMWIRIFFGSPLTEWALKRDGLGREKDV